MTTAGEYNKVADSSVLGTEGGTTLMKPGDTKVSKGDLQEIIDLSNEKTSNYDPTQAGDNASEFTTTEDVGFWYLVGKEAKGKDKCVLALGLSTACLMGIGMPAFNVFMGEMIDDMNSTSSDPADGLDGLQNTAIIMVYVAIFMFIVSWFQNTMMSKFSEALSFNTQITYFKSTLEKDATFYDTQNPMEMASKIAKEVIVMKRGFGDKISVVVAGFFTFISAIAIGFYYGWKLALFVCAGLPVLAIFAAVLGSTFSTGAVATMKAFAQSAGFAEQALQSIKVVHTYAQEPLEIKNFNSNLDGARKMADKKIVTEGVGSAFMLGMIYIMIGYVFFIGGWLRWTKQENKPGEQYSAGQILIIMFNVMTGLIQISLVMPHVKAISEAKIAGKLAYDIIDHEPNVNPNKPGVLVDKSTVKGQFEFKNVFFKYPSRDDLVILNDFSCVFEAGKTTALVGPSGSGKSTTIQLIERFYDATQGQVTLDGKDIKSYDLRSLRKCIGYVGQEPVMFNQTVAENMMYSKPDATHAEIEAALKAANAYDFIQKLEKGINTTIGGTGGGLSGGQKQRLAIARAFLKQPQILLLDEATSALDKVNEQLVQDAIDNYRKTIGNITTIVIAHRLTTIRHAEKIVVMKNGQLVEMGNHEALLEQYPDGVYADFVKKQESQNSSSPEKNNEDSPSKVTEGQGVVSKDDIKSREKAMKKQIDDLEDKEKKTIEAMKEEYAKKSGFQKLMPYNKPRFFIATALFASMVDGSIMPFIGVIMSKLLAVLGPDVDFWVTIGEPEDYFQQKVILYSSIMIYLGAGLGVFHFIQKLSFGTLGNTVTLVVRKELYTNILQKHIGWFDERENAPSVLNTIISSDTALINGVSSESLGPIVEASFAMVTGIAIAFYHSWQMALVVFGCSPAFVIGAALGEAFQKGLTETSGEAMKEANLLCGDAIVSFKTIQSFGYEDFVVEQYRKLLQPITDAAQISFCKIGFAFGFATLMQYVTFAAMFYFGGLFIKNSIGEDGIPTLNADKVFVAIFSVIFAASQAGQASSFGPDMGKANAAAEKIFKIKEFPSKIDAINECRDPSKKVLDVEKVQGKIEFKDVWFRYPTRKEDFVLKGLNLTINPNESVALVGESGCGKSTFVNLLMRFYEVDSGEILLDGVNIKEYRLHNLRTAVSLVMQEPIIFNYSILENVLYGKLDATNKEVYQACQDANALDFIEKNEIKAFDDTAASIIAQFEMYKQELIAMIGQKKYDDEVRVLKLVEIQEKNAGEFVTQEGDVDSRPESLKDMELSNGFKTMCGIKGSKLSGGQKQRVAIARTIIRKPKILLLDEATSALDEDSQKKVQQALENAMEGKTTIIIAHRMSTIEKCDKIFVLEQGRVAEEGSVSDLKNKEGGMFANIAAGKKK